VGGGGWDHGLGFVGLGPALNFGVGAGDRVDAHFVAYFAPEDPPCLKVRRWMKKVGREAKKVFEE